MQEDKRVRELIEVLDLMKKKSAPFRANSPLRVPQMATLNCIFDNTNDNNKEIKPSQISAIMGLQQPTISPILKELEKMELISRRNDDVDRRQVYYALTKKGSILATKHRRHELLMFKSLAQYLGDEDTERFVEILKKVIAYMGNKDRHCTNTEEIYDKTSQED